MVAVKKSKRFMAIFVALLLVAICFFVALISILQNSSKDALAEFEAFNSALMSMYDYDEEIVLSEDDYIIEDGEVLVTEEVAVSLQTYESNITGFYTLKSYTIEDNVVVAEGVYNRLIVYYDGDLDSCGAIAKAEYNTLHIFQYENATDAQYAYEYYSSLNLSVSYDEVVTMTDVTVEEVFDEEETVSTSYTNPWTDKTFKSWGSTYVGYSSYVENMCVRNDSLNEVIVVVVDSGINTSHVLFENRILYDYGKNFTTETSTTSYEFEDFNGHGTHVSGIIADNTLDNVKIIPLKVLDSNGSGKVTMITSAFEYIQTLAETLDIAVVNLSIGLSSGGTSTNLNNAINNLYEDCDILSVVAAGNDSSDTKSASPANATNALAVSALMLSNGTLTFAKSYSNYGDEIFLSAPGSSVYSAYIGSSTRYATLSGTSMAAPHVTAAVALLYSNPILAENLADGLTASNVKTLLAENATDLGDNGKDIYYGYGCVNIADIGATIYGYVTFSVTSGEFQSNSRTNGSFTLYLSFETSLSDLKNNYTIYYSTDDTSEENMVFVEYNNSVGIKISKTTKVSAYVKYDEENKYGYERSFITSELYLFDNYDIMSNYQFTQTDGGYILSAYNGTLSTLIVPSTYNGENIIAVGEYAFSGTNVTTLYLPDTIKTISANAFRDNTKIVQINCESTEVVVENYAFYGCTNLETLNIENITYIGNYAFYNCKKLAELSAENVTYLGSRALAYCTSLSSLKLYNIEKISDYAISATGMTEIWLGQNISSIGLQNSLSLTTVYGYSGSVAETFAYTNNSDFVDLTLNFTQNLNSNTYIIVSSLDISVQYTGLQVSATIYKGNQIVATVSSDEINQTLTRTINSIQDGDEIYVKLVDYYGNELNSEVMTVNVVDSDDTFSVSYSSGNQENYSVYVNGDLISSGDLFLKETDETEIVITIESESGYILTSVRAYVGNQIAWQLGESATSCQFTVSVGDDVQIYVTSELLEEFDVTFNTDGLAKIYVDDNEVDEVYVANRGENLTFKVVANAGYDFSYVLADGYSLTLLEEGYDDDGNCYRIYSVDQEILSEMSVTVVLKSRVITIQVTHGSGGTVSTSGEVVAYGTSQVLTISASEGYEIDFVSINGVEVEVRNNTITLSNLTEDCNIVISFKKTTSSFFSGSVGTYFIIFAVIFVLFAVAKVVLYIVQKKSKKWHTSQKD